MNQSKLLISIVFALIAFLALFTVGIWGMAPAVFLDSHRTILSRQPSPDGKRIAQVERMVVGGVPNIVVMVRSWWMPNWYLTGCAAASHYQDTNARAAWVSNDSLAVTSVDDERFWQQGVAPFHNTPCRGLNTVVAVSNAKA